MRNGPGGVQLFNLSPAWCAASDGRGSSVAGTRRRAWQHASQLAGSWDAALAACPPACPMPSSFPERQLHSGAVWACPSCCRRNVEAYALFDNSVFELPMEIWEKPSGLALCPLHIL